MKAGDIMPQFLTCDEVAEMFQVKKVTVWDWIRTKKLNAIRTGRDYRVRPEDVQDFNQCRYTKVFLK